MTDSNAVTAEILRMTAQVVAAYVSNNPVPAQQLGEVIRSIHSSLLGLETGAPASADGESPAVPIRKSVTPDYIVCLEDGKKLKMLKRHLKTSYNLSPEQYRERWGLPADYPMVAPDYAKHRSSLAKKIGLGTTPRARGKAKG